MKDTNRFAEKVKTAAMYAGLVLLALIFICPIVWLVINSFKTNNEIFQNPWGMFKTLHFENYKEAWSTGNIGRYFLNSIIVTLSSVAVTIVLSSMAAFSIVRLKWKMSKTVMVIFLMGIMIPIHSTIIPLFMMFSKLDLINRHISLILPYVAFALPVSIFILTGFFSTIPRDFDEAAVIDGATMGRVFWSIIFPISMPAVATIAIFNFVNMWNELLFAIILLYDKEKMTLPVGITYFKDQYIVNWAPLLAAVTLAAIPSILFYIFLHDRIINSLSSGALKG